MNWITNSVLPKIKALVQSNDVPDNLWVKCSSCYQMLFHQDYEQPFHSCSTCGHHAPLPPELRFKLLFDDNSYEQIDIEGIETQHLIRGFEDMLIIRKAEEKIGDKVADGTIRCPCHLGIDGRPRGPDSSSDVLQPGRHEFHTERSRQWHPAAPAQFSSELRAGPPTGHR